MIEADSSTLRAALESKTRDYQRVSAIAIWFTAVGSVFLGGAIGLSVWYWLTVPVQAAAKKPRRKKAAKSEESLEMELPNEEAVLKP